VTVTGRLHGIITLLQLQGYSIRFQAICTVINSGTEGPIIRGAGIAGTVGVLASRRGKFSQSFFQE